MVQQNFKTKLWLLKNTDLQSFCLGEIRGIKTLFRDGVEVVIDPVGKYKVFALNPFVAREVDEYMEILVGRQVKPQQKMLSELVH